MLQRFEGERARIEEMVSTGQLSQEEGQFTANLENKYRDELKAELEKLERENTVP